MWRTDKCTVTLTAVIDTSAQTMQRDFGLRLRQVRTARDFPSLASLARVVRVNPDTVGAWEAGRNYPKVPELLRLCRILGVTADYLLFGDINGLAPEAYKIIVARSAAKGDGDARS